MRWFWGYCHCFMTLYSMYTGSYFCESSLSCSCQAVLYCPHLRGMLTICSEIGSVVAVWHQSAFTQWFPGGRKPRKSFHWLRDWNGKSINFSCQSVTPDHTAAEVWWHGYGLLGQSVWLQRNLFRGRKSLAQILTINFPALHFYRISIVVDSFVLQYIHSPLMFLTSVLEEEKGTASSWVSWAGKILEFC